MQTSDMALSVDGCSVSYIKVGFPSSSSVSINSLHTSRRTFHSTQLKFPYHQHQHFAEELAYYPNSFLLFTIQNIPSRWVYSGMRASASPTRQKFPLSMS